jgi:hypothetical protein
MPPRALVAAALLGLLAACQAPKPQPTYHWGEYESALYNLMKRPQEVAAYGAALKRQLDQDPTGARIPPGILAEYGYCLYLTGDKGEAASFFLKEKTRWPEATLLMDKMIALCAAAPQ